MTENSKENLHEGLKARGVFIQDPAKQVHKKARLTLATPVTLGSVEIAHSAFIGRYTYMRSGRIASIKSIGAFCSIGPDVSIGDGNHPTKFLSTHPFQYGQAHGFDFWPEYKQFRPSCEIPQDVMKAAPVIGNDVWIGGGVTITRGVTIHDGAVIAGGSVVTKDVVPYEIVGGVPAKHIRFRFPEETIARLLKCQWWQYDLKSLEGIPFDDVNKSLDELIKRAEEELLRKPPYRRIIIENGSYKIIPTTN